MNVAETTLANHIASHMPMGRTESGEPSELTMERVRVALQRAIDDIVRRSMTSRSGLAVCAGLDPTMLNVSKVSGLRSQKFLSIVKLADAAGLTMAEFGELFDAELARV